MLLVEVKVDSRRVVPTGNNVMETTLLLVITASDDDPRDDMEEMNVLESVVD
jgi:hypothetical protein